jgi:uncharacterized protein (DUF1800 family)
LLYLDGSGSVASAPNENYAREVMELFALGRGNYTENDVKAGAVALAGWHADYETGDVTFDETKASASVVEFLGRSGKLRVDDVVDALVSHSNCAPFIASKIFTYLVGVAPSKERTEHLGKILKSRKYQITPLLEEIVHDPNFLLARMNRPRYPIEWFVAAVDAIGQPRDNEESDIAPWTLEQLDQLPFKPPNVAGWPPGPKWLSASQQLARAAYVWASSSKMRPIEEKDPVAHVLRRCGIYECSDATRAVLRESSRAQPGESAFTTSRRLMTVALLSPEFAMA